MAYLVDTDIAIEHLGDNTSVTRLLDRILGLPMFLSWATLAEMYEGAHGTSNPEAYIQEIRHAFRTFKVQMPTEEIAVRFGELRAHLRWHGRMIGDFDLVIAATALEHDLTLITFNKRHFERIPDLRYYSGT